MGSRAGLQPMPGHLELCLAVATDPFQQRNFALRHQHVEQRPPQGRALLPDNFHEVITRLLRGGVGNRDARRAPGTEIEREVWRQPP